MIGDANELESINSTRNLQISSSKKKNYKQVMMKTRRKILQIKMSVMTNHHVRRKKRMLEIRTDDVHCQTGSTTVKL